MSDKGDKPDSRQPHLLHPIALAWVTLLGLSMAVIALVSELDTTIKRLEAVGVAIVLLAVFLAADLGWTRNRLRRSVALVLMVSDTLVAFGLGGLFLYRTNIPPPPLASLVPAGYSIVEKDSVVLDGRPVPEWWVASQGPTTVTASPMDLQVVEWRDSARSWQVAFDAAVAVADGPEKGNVTIPPDAYDTFNVVLVGKMRPGESRQLMFSVDVQQGNRPVGVVGILDYVNGALKLVRVERFLHGVSDAQLTGASPNQRLVIDAQWTTDADSVGYPTRLFKREVGYASYGLHTVSDDRPWLGVMVVSLHSDLANRADAHVAAVVDTSPAAGVFQPGDLLLDVDGKVPSGIFDGAAFVRALALHMAGDVVTIGYVRHGQQLSATLKLDSWATLDAIERSPFSSEVNRELHPSTLGADFDDGSVQSGSVPIRGAFVKSVQKSGPAAQAGIGAGSLITSVGNVTITSGDDLRMQTYLVKAGTALPLTFFDAFGVSRGAVVTFGTPSGQLPTIAERV